MLFHPHVPPRRQEDPQERPWVVMLFHPHGPPRKHEDPSERTWVVMLFHPHVPPRRQEDPLNLPGGDAVPPPALPMGGDAVPPPWAPLNNRINVCRPFRTDAVPVRSLSRIF